MQEKLNIALIQSTIIWENPTENRRVFTEKIISVYSNIDIVVLPEMFTTGFSMDPEKFAESMNGETVLWMQKLEKPFFVVVIKNIVLYQIKNDNFELSIIVPLRKKVLNLHDLH